MSPLISDFSSQARLEVNCSSDCKISNFASVVFLLVSAEVFCLSLVFKQQLGQLAKRYSNICLSCHPHVAMEVLSARPDAVGAKIVRDKDSYVNEATFGKQLNMGAGSQWRHHMIMGLERPAPSLSFKRGEELEIEFNHQ